jgi:hypothetical protein
MAGKGMALNPGSFYTDRLVAVAERLHSNAG